MKTSTMSKMKVPYKGLGSCLGEEELQAVREALSQDDLCSGIYVRKFERAFAEYTGAEYAIACSNCTTALELATAAIGLKEGDEVITTPITFIATSLPLLKRNVKVVFADIDPQTFNIGPNEIEKHITERTRAIYVVHYAGLSADMDSILSLAKKYNLRVVEDAAHASGAEYRGKKVGNIGDITCFSFQSLKNMTTLGDGGMVTTNDEQLDEKIRLLKTFNIKPLPGRVKKYGHRDKEIPFYWDVVCVGDEVGLNYRMSEVESAVGLVQLRKLDRLNARRIEIAQRLNSAFADNPALTVPYSPEECKHVYHLYTLLVDEQVIGSKDRFMEILDKEYGIDVWTQYCPNYLYTIYRSRGYQRGLCPIAERIFFESLVNLPIYPTLTDKQVEYMINAVQETVERLKEE